jgi:hypothetical protein
MYAWRTVWTIKPGRMAEAQALTRGLLDSFGPDPAYANSSARMYFSQSATGGTLVWEEVWPTTEGHDQWLAGWRQTPEAAAFSKAWSQEVDRASPEEVWEVSEWRW